MPHWYLKAALQGAISKLPNPQASNRILQRRVTGSLRLTREYFETKVETALRHLSNVESQGAPEGIHRSLELGTGWIPVVPVALALTGVDEVITADVQDLLVEPVVRETLEMFGASIAEDPSRYREGAADLVAAALTMVSIDAMLSAVHVRRLVGNDPLASIEESSIDLITSNSTFEHIPPDELSTLLTEFRRVIANRGLMSHLIDLGDHYAVFDQRLTPYNFLTFSEREWRKFNNPLHYQNRLRWSDYQGLAVETGWALLVEDTEQDVQRLRSITIHPEFSSYAETDAAIHTGWLVVAPVPAELDMAASRVASSPLTLGQ